MSHPGKLSVQLYSVREHYAADLGATLARLREIGFRHVEPFGLGALDPADAPAALRRATDLRAALDAEGLAVSGTHAAVPADVDTLLAELDALGATTVFAPTPGMVAGFENEAFAAATTVDAFADRMLEVAEALRGNGIALGYHNHWWEWADLGDGTTGYDRFWNRVGDALVAELDVYWATAAGQDPARVLGMLGERAVSLHLKDGPARPDEPQLPLGQGRVDVEAAVAATQARWHVAEIDSTDLDEFELLAGNAAALRERGLSDF
ncbi:sugar phosphate isomerase/epimerase [Kineococcus xinjiangensis]|uniref:Sugar phosphate isomerase/epimerase n=1 Tax=Kineococcus xinjiangensis TaxID=512762 RepID=A0A2S6ITA6_9ACTN|nr:sugar phosphate isomerase/epimerase [Kineococcus xinjiangensis]PPK97487.1 sugar phosphate isomerase/epimerase [Kineococcus xinjiangensis]